MKGVNVTPEGALAGMTNRLARYYDDETLGVILEGIETPRDLALFLRGCAQTRDNSDDFIFAEEALSLFAEQVPTEEVRDPPSRFENVIFVPTEEAPMDVVADMESPVVALKDLDVPDEGIQDQAEVTLSEDREPLLERMLHWIASKVVVDEPPNFPMDERGKYLIPLKREGVVFTLPVYPNTWHNGTEKLYLSNGWEVCTA